MAALLPRPLFLTRLSWCGLGIVSTAASYVALQRQIWRQATEISTVYGLKVEPVTSDAAGEESLVGPRARALLVRKWNRLVDDTLGAWVTELAKRGV